MRENQWVRYNSQGDVVGYRFEWGYEQRKNGCQNCLSCLNFWICCRWWCCSKMCSSRRGVTCCFLLNAIIVVALVVGGVYLFTSRLPNDATTILYSGAKLMKNQVFKSPNGAFDALLNDNGELVLRDSKRQILWKSQGGASYCKMQEDGNLVCYKQVNGTITWRTRTSEHHGATLQIDDGGQLQVLWKKGASLWLAGLPRGRYDPRRPRKSLQFPVRGMFYYPWFPETWSVEGSPVKYNPTLGKYTSGDPDVQRAHIRALEYSQTDVAIASWWGPDRHLDRARLTNLLEKSHNSNVKWSIYHESERDADQTVEQLQADLEYLKKWYVWHKSWAFVDDRPVIFVYNEGECEVARRWMSATEGKWYVVLKQFINHEDCEAQPDFWHEYGPSTDIIYKRGSAFSISPGFWRADLDKAYLDRLTQERWSLNVESMVRSNATWQLITTFNEWGEGTAVEGASEWSSSSGYGYYLDALHEIC